MAAAAPQSKYILPKHSWIIYCLDDDWEIYRTKLLTTPVGTGDIPKIQAILQQRIHPTMSCPKPPFVSQPSNMSRTCRTHRQPLGKAKNPDWSCWAALWPWNILLFPKSHWLAVMKINLHKHGCAPSSSPCSHHAQRALSEESYRSSSHLLPVLPGSPNGLTHPPLGASCSLPTHLLLFQAPG